MKTYKQLMEVMSISDMNKIKGGTDHQRKIAQDRQKRREAKNKGFDPNKSVMADGSKPSEEKKTSTPPSSAIVKADKPVAKGGAIQKAAPAEVTKRKPDLRKSQLGKWSEGAKKSPGALAKKAASAVTKTDPVKKVDVKVDEPKKTTPAPGNKRTPVPDRSYLPTGKRPEPETPAEKAKKKKKKKKGDNLFTKLRKKVANVDVNPDVSTYAGQQQKGLQQRGNQVSS